MSNLEEDCMMAVVSFSEQFGVDLKPTGNKVEKDGQFSVQFKANGREFFDEKFEILNPKFSLWFTNKDHLDYIKVRINLVLGTRLFDEEHSITAKYKNESWSKLNF